METEPIKRHGLTFEQYFLELKGFQIFKRNIEVQKWELFWSNIPIKEIFREGSGYRAKDKK
jgi:hypothetical protein